MSFDQFPETQYIRVLETDETAEMGGYEVADATALDTISLRLQKDGTATGSETFQIEIYQNLESTTPLYTSTAKTMNDINTEILGFNVLTVSNFIGDVAFEFNRECLIINTPYFFKLKSSSYTRNGDTFFIGFGLDNAERVNSRKSENQVAARAVIVGFR